MLIFIPILIFVALVIVGAAAMRLAKTMRPDEALVVNMSGRGDKDLFITAKALDRERWIEFLKSEVNDG